MPDGTSALYLRDLDIGQMREIYLEHMTRDFPESELKPLDVIEQGMRNGFYRFAGLFDGDEIAAYTGLIYHESACLIDYLAVLPERRGCGTGTVLLKQLNEYLKDIEYVIGEVEDPAYGEDEEERKLRTRRMEFYLRNGYRDTGKEVCLFGVRFRLIYLMRGTPHDTAEILMRYRNTYRRILPENLFRDNVLTD